MSELRAIRTALLIVAIIVVPFVVSELTLSQEQKIKQTDPTDLTQRQRIDRDLYGEIRKLRRETQADTFYLTAGDTADTIFMGNKYSDTDYVIFAWVRTIRGTNSLRATELFPLTDSSFEVRNKHANDSCTIQWMTIHK